MGLWRIALFTEVFVIGILVIILLIIGIIKNR
jgi:hypothetical protein